MKIRNGINSKRSGSRALEVVVGVAWYYPEQWTMLLKVSVDRDSLEKSHGEWLHLAEKAMFDIKRSGMSPRKVYVDVNQLLAWCTVKNLPVGGTARARFVQEQLAEKPEVG